MNILANLLIKLKSFFSSPVQKPSMDSVLLQVNDTIQNLLHVSQSESDRAQYEADNATHYIELADKANSLSKEAVAESKKALTIAENFRKIISGNPL